MSQPPMTPPPYGPRPGDGGELPKPPSYEPWPSSVEPPASSSGAPEPAKVNTMAVVSLVSAFLISVVAVITGHVALRQIKQTGERGVGMAIAGLVLGYLGLVVGLIVFILFGVLVVTVPVEPDTGTLSTSSPAEEATDADLTFAAGSSLAPTSQPYFRDFLERDPDWVVVTRDDTTGYRVYEDAAGMCTTQLNQATLDAATTITPGDDRATTDSFLASSFQAPIDDLAGHVEDDVMAYNTIHVVGDALVGPTADTRSIVYAAGGGSTGVRAARAFGVPGIGMLLDVSCSPGGDLDAAYSHILSKVAIAVE